MHPRRRVVIAALAVTIGATVSPQIAAAGKAPAVLASLPDDTTLIAGIDMKKIVAAPIAADALALMQQRAADELARMKDLGIDLEQDVTKAYFAVAGASLTDIDHARLKILVLEGKIAIDATAVKDATKKTHAGVSYWSAGNGDFAVIGKRLFAVGDGAMPALIDVIKGKAKNAAKSAAAKKLRAAISATTVSHQGWMAGVVTDADRAVIGTQGGDLDWFSASAALRKDAVDFVIRLGMLSPAAAKSMADQAQTQLGTALQSMASIGLGDLAKSLSVAASGSSVAIGATITGQEISVIAGMARMMGSPTPTPTPTPMPVAPKGARPSGP